MQRNNEDQFRSLRTKNKKNWRKNIISFHKKKKKAEQNFHMNEISARTAYPECTSLRNEETTGRGKYTPSLNFN